MPGVVTVACKMPGGVILRLFDMVDHDVPVLGGGVKTSKIAQMKGEKVKIGGYAAPIGKVPNFITAGGFALTPNVDADFFNEWLKQNADSNLVKNKLIFAHEKSEVVERRAREMKDERSGFEALDPDKLPAEVRRIKTMTKKDE